MLSICRWCVSFALLSTVLGALPHVHAEAVEPSASPGSIGMIEIKLPTPDLSLDYWVTIDKLSGRRLAKYTDPGRTLSPTGQFQILIRQYSDLALEISAAPTLIVKRGKVAKVELGAIQFIDSTTSEQICIERLGVDNDKIEIRDPNRIYLLPPGEYRLRFKSEQLNSFREFKIRPGHLTSVSTNQKL